MFDDGRPVPTHRSIYDEFGATAVAEVPRQHEPADAPTTPSSVDDDDTADTE